MARKKSKKPTTLTCLDAHPHDGNNRIFIVGVPRCGSTLLESILATNPCLKDLGETTALAQAIYNTSENTNKEKKHSLCKLYDEQVARTVPSNHSSTVDKNLYNFINVSHIARSMPSAKIIHCKRHPLDNILSMLRPGSSLKQLHLRPSRCRKDDCNARTNP